MRLGSIVGGWRRVGLGFGRKRGVRWSSGEVREGAFLGKLPPFAIVDSTLREGEQFATTEFTSQDRIYIAKTLDNLGVEYIEVVNPIASTQAARDCKTLSSLGLRAKILAHTRCHLSDVEAAIRSGVAGVNIYMATSPILSQHSHGKGMDAVMAIAKEVIRYVQSANVEVRFSCEDSFRSKLEDILELYRHVDKLGVHRVGVADTVGVATPEQVTEVVGAVREAISPSTGIEFHTHNDTGCCIANAYLALRAGATHIDTSVLGIGERNGITPLGGFLSRLYSLDRELITSKYDLRLLRHLDKYVAQASQISIPFNNYITGFAAFTHKAGVHSKAVMSNPQAYEILDPEDFGVERRIQLAHRLTGWNAMQHRAKQLGLDLSDDQIKAATTMIKNLADNRTLSIDQVDTILMNLASGPRTSSSSFMSLKPSKDVPDHLFTAAKEAATALARYEAAAAAAAVSAIGTVPEDTRPSITLTVTGHLFDKAVLNRLLDVLVDSPCDFEVLRLDVAPKDELSSSCVLRLWSATQEDLVKTRETMQKLVDANKTIANCQMTEAAKIDAGEFL